MVMVQMLLDLDSSKIYWNPSADISGNSAAFAGTVKSTTFDNTPDDAAAHGFRIENIPSAQISLFDFQISTARPDSFEAFRIYKGDTDNVNIHADGSATFAKQITATKGYALAQLPFTAMSTIK